jgi:hypothetical protein
MAAVQRVRKDLEKTHKDAMKTLYQGRNEVQKKRKLVKTTPRPPSKNRPESTTKQPDQKSKTPKPKTVTNDPQGERKVPIPSDSHGCAHSGLLELLSIDKKHLRAHVKVGGWLHDAPCKDCALGVSCLLTGRGTREVGFCCNCGPVGHKMVTEKEPARKQQWTCDMILCMDCFNKRKLGMGDSSKRSSRRRSPLN